VLLTERIGQVPDKGIGQLIRLLLSHAMGEQECQLAWHLHLSTWRTYTGRTLGDVPVMQWLARKWMTPGNTPPSSPSGHF
jgi:hypothetical protein